MDKRKKKTKHLSKSLEKKAALVNLFNPTKQQYIVLGTIVGIFILRLIYLLELSKNDPLFYHPLPGTDQNMYWQAAYQIINGEFPLSPFEYNPLYYYFLALCLEISDYNLFGVRIIQALLGVGTCILVYLMGKRLFNYHVGLISLILSGICGTLIFHDGILLSTTLTTFLCTAFLFFLLRLKDKFNKKDLVISGICFGLGCLSQPNAILFLPFVLIWLFFVLPFKKKKTSMMVGGFLLITMLTISPVTIRNYAASGKFILLTKAGPFQFWLGNNEHSPGWYDLCQPYLGQLEERIKKEKNKNLFMEDILKFIKEKPYEYVRLFIKKILLFYGSWDIPHQVGYDDAKQYSFILRLPFLLDFGIVAILGFTGVMLSIKNYRKFLLLYLFIFAYSFSVILFLVVGRYRPPVLPPLIIFSAFTLWWCYQKFHLKQYKFILLSLSLIGCFSSIVYSQIIIDRIHIIKHPYGIMKHTEDGFILTDSSDRNNRGFAITDTKMIKKELLLNVESSKIKEVYLNLTYNCNEEGNLVIALNDETLPVLNFKDLYSAVHGIVGQVSLGPIESSVLKKGINIITLQVKEKGYINVPVDACYNYGRSLFSLDNGKTWKKEKGEYKIELKLASKS